MQLYIHHTHKSEAICATCNTKQTSFSCSSLPALPFIHTQIRMGRIQFVLTYITYMSDIMFIVLIIIIIKEDIRSTASPTYMQTSLVIWARERTIVCFWWILYRSCVYYPSYTVPRTRAAGLVANTRSYTKHYLLFPLTSNVSSPCPT